MHLLAPLLAGALTYPSNKEECMMKKGLNVILVVLLVAALGVFAVAGKEAAAAGGRTIVVGVNSENPPWIFVKDGKMTGFEADLLEEFAKRAGYKIEYKSAPFATVLTGVQSGQWEIAMSSIWIKKERAAVMDFADPYYDSGIGLMTRKGGITDLSQMKGKTFGSDTGSANEAWLVNSQDKYGPYKVKSYDYWVDAALDLETGRIDGVVVDDPIALYYIKQHPDSGLVMKIYIPGFKAGQALAFKKESPLRKIHRKWFGVDPPKDSSVINIVPPYMPNEKPKM
jgi:polar amino acid transport system substrate-binding protein